MSERRSLICIGCPMGCPLTVELEGGEILSVSGNTCKRGDTYARREVISPTRVLTTTVPVQGGTCPTVPVKTAGEIPKALLLDCVRALQPLQVSAPLRAGQVICRDLLGTGIDLIATRDVAAKEP